jgi:transposase
MIADRTGLSRRGLEQLWQRFVEEGFETTITGKQRGHRPKALGGADEARLRNCPVIIFTIVIIYNCLNHRLSL